MSKSTLVFFPTGLNTPEAEVLSATIQSLLDQKLDVTILTCAGGKDYSCAKNLFSINTKCLHNNQQDLSVKTVKYH